MFQTSLELSGIHKTCTKQGTESFIDQSNHKTKSNKRLILASQTNKKLTFFNVLFDFQCFPKPIINCEKRLLINTNCTQCPMRTFCFITHNEK